ncbi:MAG: 3-hydroxyacyl-CoA dehydrogenase NAD-binding domain-containing protein [Candidatus Eisenbacteria bacterium]
MIERIAVLGAGIMGRGIAYAAAVAGYDTTLYDASPVALEEGMADIRALMDKGVAAGKLAAEARDKARLTPKSDLDGAAVEADLVIEAIPENMKLKRETFERLDGLTRPEAILASNTSSLSITEMAATTKRPGQVVGMHFFNPVHRMKLLEVVRGLETDDRTIEAVTVVGMRMGKEAVVVREAPGFVTTRVNALIGNEAFRMLEEGVASARDIDKALKLGLNHPMGPFELVDLVGLDTRLSILEFLFDTLGERYRPNNLMVQYVKAGRLGKKSGRGVYEYNEGA